MLSLRRSIAPLVGVLAVVATLLSSCTGAHSGGAKVLNGAALELPASLPADLTFDRSDGNWFTTGQTRGRVSLFFFGYTHCADVCPLTLAEFSERLGWSVPPTSSHACRRRLGSHGVPGRDPA